MNDTPSAYPETVAAKLPELAATREQFAELKGRHSQFSDQIAQQIKAAEAAEGEAKTARQKLRELLRESVGRLTKKHYDLKAEERAAYSLAEDFKALATELTIEQDRLVPELNRLAHKYSMTLLSARRALSEHLYSSALAHMDEDLVASLLMQAKFQKEDLGSAYNNGAGRNSEDAIEYVAKLFLVPLIARLRAESVKRRHNLYPPELAGDLDTSGMPNLSPIAVRKFADDLKAREEQGYTL